MPEFDQANAAIIDRDNRLQAAAGIPMSQTLNDLYDLIGTGTIGITAVGADVDSIALGGGAFSANPTTTSGLNFGYSAGRIRFGQTVLSVAAGTIALTPSAVNFVEVDNTGTVSANTVSFTPGRIQLYTITAGVSEIATVVVSKVLLDGAALASIPGALLTTAASTKSLTAHFPSPLSAAASVLIPLPAHAGTIRAIVLTGQTNVAQSDTNYWTLGVTDAGASGTMTTAVVDSTIAANSTKVTGGSGFASCAARGYTLTANTATASGDVLVATLTPSSTNCTPLTLAAIRVDLGFSV